MLCTRCSEGTAGGKRVAGSDTGSGRCFDPSTSSGLRVVTIDHETFSSASSVDRLGDGSASLADGDSSLLGRSGRARSGEAGCSTKTGIAAACLSRVDMDVRAAALPTCDRPIGELCDLGSAGLAPN